MAKILLEVPEELKGMVPALQGLIEWVKEQVERAARVGPWTTQRSSAT